jgi:molybdopterin-guanine dinucleotide biosynthesis protein A
MGRDKARLPFRGGELAAAVAGAVARAAGNVTLVGHSELSAIPDLYPGEGPLGGILTALHHTSAVWNLIVACDMPRLSDTFLAELLARAMRSPAAVILPCGPDGLPQPLCAVYHKRALPTLEDHFNRGIRKVTAALTGLTVERLAVAELSLFQNVNTPEDWAPYAAK